MRRGPGAAAPGAIGVRAWARAGTAGSGAATVGGARRANGAPPGGNAVCPPGPVRAGAAFGGVVGAAFGAGLFGGVPLRRRSRSPAPPDGGAPTAGAFFC